MEHLVDGSFNIRKSGACHSNENVSDIQSSFKWSKKEILRKFSFGYLKFTRIAKWL